MADNTVLNGATVPGGDSVRDISKGGVKTQVVTLDIGGAGAELLMAGSMPVTLSQPSGSANWGQSLSATAGSTTTVVSLVSSLAGYRCMGMVCHGTGDGYFVIQIGGVSMISGRIRSASPMLILPIAGGILITVASNVTIKVTNESGATADYEATLLGT